MTQTDRSESRIEARELWATLVRRQWVVYTVAGLVLAVTAFRSFTATPMYRATALVEIQRWTPDVLNFKDILRSDPTWQGHNAFFETQYRILESRAVARRAAERLDLPNHPLLPRREPSLIRRALSGARRALSAGPRPPDPEGDGPADPMAPYTALVLGGLSVEPVHDSNLVEIGFLSEDPRFSAQVANAVARAYIEFTLSARFDTTEQASDFLAQRVGELRDEVEELESRLQSYREEREILPSGASEEFTMKGVADLNTLYLAVRAQRIETESRWLAAQESDPSSLPAVVDNAGVVRLQNEVDELEIRRAEMLRTFKPGWPEVEAVDRKLEQARERLRRQSESVARTALAADEANYRAARKEEERIERLLQDQKSAAQRAGRDAIVYGTLRAEAERKRAVLDALLQRQNETAVSSQLRDMGTGNARVVDRATAPRLPASPRPLVELPMGLFVGLLLGVGAAIALEAWDNTIRTPEEVERSLRLPTLARLPLAAEERRSGPAPAGGDIDLISHRDPASPMAEASRDLRTALSLSSAGEPVRLLVVTSTRPGEGKTTVALNLAVVLAQSGRKVLLVDADLRRPRLHRALGVRNAVGLSTVLCGKAALAQAVVATEVPNLHLLPGGPVPPNPAELLDSSAFEELLGRMSETGAGMVILDSAPLLTVSDGAIVSARAEGTLLVIEADRTTRDEAHRAVEKLRQGPGKILGAVLNKAPEAGDPYGRYRYRSPADEDGEEDRAGQTGTVLVRAARRLGRRRG